MKKTVWAKIFFAVLWCGVLLWSAAAQDNSAIRKMSLPSAEIDRIIKAFSAKEAEFRNALRLYGFKRSATVQTVGMGKQITGEYRRDSLFAFNDTGKRFEKVLFAPIPTLTEVSVTPEDIDDLNGVNQFPLEPSKIDQYNFTFVGKEKIDDLDLYVFDVEPKNADPKKTRERFFKGRIWVDDKDLQIVKSMGKGVPETKQNKFPITEIYRENVDGKYWFPTYAYANDELVFDSGQVVRMKMKILYQDYKEFQSTVRLLGSEEVIDESGDKPAPTASPTPAAKTAPTPMSPKKP